jgi:peptide/nickel transport system permease protein
MSLPAGRLGADRDDLRLAGLGNCITDALFAAAMPAVLSGAIVLGVVFVTLKMLADILSRLVDPQARG